MIHENCFGCLTDSPYLGQHSQECINKLLYLNPNFKELQGLYDQSKEMLKNFDLETGKWKHND